MNWPEHPSRDTARLWAIRVQDPAFDGWDELAHWLEAAPDHLAAYEAALEDDQWAAGILASGPAHPAARPGHLARPRRRAMLAGIAAAILAVMGGWLLLGLSSYSEIGTGPGEHRLVQLADGSQVAMNGGTRIRFDPELPRMVTLLEGEALFNVRHDRRTPFVVQAGASRLVDLGTVFNVTRDDGALDVAVAEGAVMFAPGPREIRLDAGDALRIDRGAAAPLLRKVSPASVGGWQAGQLQYDNAPLDLVARDLARTTGLDIRPGKGTAQMRFTGMLFVKGSAEEVFARIGPLLGVSFAEQGDGWMMTAKHGPAP